jgi:hypothetical protein
MQAIDQAEVLRGEVAIRWILLMSICKLSKTTNGELSYSP